MAADEAGAGSAHRVDATQVVMSNGGDPAYPDLAVYAIDTYRTEAEARQRAEAALADAQQRLMAGGSMGDASGFTVAGDGYWICGGWRGLTYAELELSPGSSSTEAIAGGTLSALLDYAARMSKLAESD